MSDAKMTVERAVELVKKHGGVTAAARAAGIDTKTLSKWYNRRQAESVCSDQSNDSGAISVAGADGGFSLTGKSMTASKPTNIWPARFAALRKNMGYYPEQLAAQWGASVGTIRSHAQDLGCIRYVMDTKNGDYKACVVHPDTIGGK